MATKKQTGIKKTRSYATVVYPDSAPENWVEILRDLKFNAIISPLHDKLCVKDKCLSLHHILQAS